MQYRKLGRSGLKISPICLGTMMFGGPTDEATSTRIVAKARAAGINFIDTADNYNKGVSEQVVGRAIGKDRVMARSAISASRTIAAGGLPKYATSATGSASSARS